MKSGFCKLKDIVCKDAIIIKKEKGEKEIRIGFSS